MESKSLSNSKSVRLAGAVVAALFLVAAVVSTQAAPPAAPAPAAQSTSATPAPPAPAAPATPAPASAVPAKAPAPTAPAVTAPAKAAAPAPAVPAAHAQKPAQAVAGKGGHRDPDSNKVYDLYIMSMCPYGITALRDLAEFIRVFPQREWNVWFIGRVEGDNLSSLRGEPEMFDEALWLGVKALYPFRYHEFLFLRASSKARTEELLAEMELDVGKIRHWAEDIGPTELRQHYIRSTDLRVNASPTLYVNGKEHDRRIGGGRLILEECKAAVEKPDVCADYPECFEDADCRAVGKIGRCVSEAGAKAVCEFRNDAAFAVKVLIADSALNSPEKQVIEALSEMLPGAKVSVVRFSSEEGKRMVASYSPAALPFFYFDKGVEKAARFSEVSNMLEAVGGGGYRFKKGAVGENYFPLRAEKPGTIKLYVDPLIPNIAKIVNLFVSNPDLAKRVVLRPIITKDPRTAADFTIQDRLRNEEALRWIVLETEKDFHKKYLAYMEYYGGDVASSYWFTWLKKIGVNQNKLLKRVNEKRPKLAEYWDDIAPVTAGESVVLLIGNRIKFVPSGEADLVRVLGEM